MDYTEKSKLLTKQIKQDVKKKNGIYFTPPSIIEKHAQILKKHMKSVKKVLEPSCGSCEYIKAFQSENYYITGIEHDNTIYDAIKDDTYTNTTLIHADYLNWETTDKFDLIIGNPPYFVINKNDMPDEYKGYYDGRPNIFIAFILKSLGLLNEGGILGFVLPASFLNCLYYDKLRQYVNDNYNILDITECTTDKYLDTNQETIIFTIKKQKRFSNKDYVSKHLDYTVFNTKDKTKELTELCKDTTTLCSMGMNVNVGNVVWNQKKDELTNDDTKTRLIYSSDIKDNKLVLTKYKNVDKKNYIRQDGKRDLILVINRGYGTGKYNFGYSLIDVDYDYLIENHLICIRSTGDKSRDELKTIYDKIIKSFENDKTKKFIELYFGNSAINTTEMKFILPIY
jgi:type I restriction-modification system DNA methylase subunit